MTALALLAAYSVTAGLITLDDTGRLAAGGVGINLLQPQILVGLIIGAMLPFIFSAPHHAGGRPRRTGHCR